MKKVFVLPTLVLLLTTGFLAFLGGCSSGEEFPEGVSGVVYEDVNLNGIRDDGEPGIRDVIVSNGAVSRLTDKAGNYNLPGDGSFVFLSVPNDYAPTTGWYADFSGEDVDFGLKQMPDKGGSDFTFVQLSDIHFDEGRVSDLAEVVSEVNRIAPQFVMVTGDMATEANSATREKAEGWFGLYGDTMEELDAPLFHAIGNHDLVGISRDDSDSVDMMSAKELYETNFGPTYYSFDWGEYHCVVLDPHDLVEGQYVFHISDRQLEWLEGNLTLREESPLMVFFHEPTTAWENRGEVLELLAGRDAYFFCGHSHMDVLMDTEGIPEQITGAVCGEWWFGDNLSGQPPGYRIVSVSGQSIDSLYRWSGTERMIELDLSSPVVSGQIDLRVRVFSDLGVPSEVYYRVGDGPSVAMDVADGPVWSVATATWDASSMEDGYYALRIDAIDGGGGFGREVEVKVSEDETVPIAETLSHFDTFHGYHITLEGAVSFSIVGPSTYFGVPAGIGVYQISDASGDRMLIIAGECKSPPLPKNLTNDLVRVEVVPVRLTMDFLESSGGLEEYYSMIESYTSLLPEGLIEMDETGMDIIAVRGMRLMSAADLEVVS